MADPRRSLPSVEAVLQEATQIQAHLAAQDTAIGAILTRLAAPPGT